MGFMDKILNVMKLDPDDDFEYDNDDFELGYDEEDEPAPAKSKLSDIEDEKKRPVKEKKQPSKITPIRAGRSSRQAQDNEMEVCVIRPTMIEDEREITDTLLDGRTVVLNVEGLAVDTAQRIIDFISGSTYALGGNLQKISNYIFILTPPNVDISGDFQNYMDSFDVNSFRNEF